eukprot:1160429-Pelagomonas_calceolata.AAC.21
MEARGRTAQPQESAKQANSRQRVNVCICVHVRAHARQRQARVTGQMHVCSRMRALATSTSASILHSSGEISHASHSTPCVQNHVNLVLKMHAFKHIVACVPLYCMRSGAPSLVSRFMASDPALPKGVCPCVKSIP